jgi:8-oxo-dGTP diphosphatase
MGSKAQEYAIAVVQQGGLVLVGNRGKGRRLEGMFEFPGGKLRKDETPEEGVVRKLFEETGISALPVSRINVVDFTYPFKPVRLYYIYCRPPSNAPEPKKPYFWCPMYDLDERKFPPANLDAITWLVTRTRVV